MEPTVISSSSTKEGTSNYSAIPIPPPPPTYAAATTTTVPVFGAPIAGNVDPLTGKTYTVLETERALKEREMERANHQAAALDYAQRKDYHAAASRTEWETAKNPAHTAGTRIGAAIDSAIHKVREISSDAMAKVEQKRA